MFSITFISVSFLVLHIQADLGSSYNSYNVADGNPLTPEETLDDNNNTIVAQYTLPISRTIPPNPLFYGWFYNYDGSDSLRLISEKYFAKSYDHVPEFKTFLDKLMNRMNITDPFAYYIKPADPETGRIDPYYHTTAKYCGRQDCSEYGVRVEKHLGRVFQMHLVGLFFTPRTYGVRVKLTQAEQDIFEFDERKNTFQAAQPSAINNTSEAIGSHNSLGDTGHEYEGYFHSGTVSNHPLYPGIHFVPQSPDFHPTESVAHITLGCAKGVGAEQTGFDLLEIIDLEITGSVHHQDFSIGGSDTPVATLRQFGESGEGIKEGVEGMNEIDEQSFEDGEGDGQGGEAGEVTFVIYPTEKMVTDATFTVYL